MTRRKLTIGTRGSALALRQAEMVVEALRRAHPGLEPELRVFTPLGDRDKTRPLSQLGGQGVFVREIEQALLAGEIDAAVHSLKDLSGVLPDGLTLASITRREDPRDAWISRHGRGPRDLPRGAAVGTSSARRAVQLRALRPDFAIVDLRGNIDTRLRKAEAPPYDAIVLAAVGLERMGWQDRVTEYLDPREFLPMVGQGARAVETRADDRASIELLRPLDHAPTRLATSAERAFLRRLGAGCRAAIAAHATFDPPGGDDLTIEGLIGDPRGTALYRTAVRGHAPTVEAAEALGEELATRLLNQGADRLITCVVGAAPPLPPDPGGEERAVLPQPPSPGGSEVNGATRPPDRLIAGPGVLPPGIGGAGGGRPLLGRRILVTRARPRAGDLSRALAALGAIPVELPAIRFEPPEDTAPLDAAIDRLDSYAWVIFTSANGVDRFCERLRDRGREPRDLARARLAAIGDGTARALRRWGLTADIVPERFIAEAVVERLAREDLAGAHVLIPRAAEARDVLPRELARLGASVDLVPVYRTVAASPDPAVLAMLAAGEIDIVTFTSSSTVTHLLALIENAERGARNAEQRRDPLGGALVACIGPITAQTAREHGLRVDLVAEEHSIPGLVAVLAEWATRTRPGSSTAPG